MPKKQINEPSVIDIVIPAYNARHIIHKSVQSTLMQELPAGWRKSVIIIDDGSSDDTVKHCREVFKEKVYLISHRENRGRSATRNTGWRVGRGCYVVFLDADCEWLASSSLSAHIEKLQTGVDVSMGPIIADDESFWGLYQNMLQSSREKSFATGNHAAFTSANFAISRSCLEATGGFDEGYRHYGFEDRDYLLRLVSIGAKLALCQKAAVRHVPDLSLIEVCRKMFESAHYSSPRFQEAHPEYYALSIYGKIDCRLHKFPLTVLGSIFNPLVPALSRLGDMIIRIPGIPFKIKWVLVKLMSSIAYLTGTYIGYKGV